MKNLVRAICAVELGHDSLLLLLLFLLLYFSRAGIYRWAAIDERGLARAVPVGGVARDSFLSPSPLLVFRWQNVLSLFARDISFLSSIVFVNSSFVSNTLFDSFPSSLRVVGILIYIAACEVRSMQASFFYLLFIYFSISLFFVFFIMYVLSCGKGSLIVFDNSLIFGADGEQTDARCGR